MIYYLLTIGIIAASLYGYTVYGLATMRRKIRPRTMTWFIWALLSTCVAYLQLKHGAGLGASVTMIAAGANYILAFLAWRYGHRTIHPIDSVSIVATIGVLLLWLFASDETTVLFAAVAYAIGFVPTFERSYRKPHVEMLQPFVMNVLKYSASLVVMGSYNFETVIYPLILAFLNVFFLCMIWWRRKMKKSSQKPLQNKT